MIGDAFIVIRPDLDEFRPLAETGVRSSLAGIHPTVPVGLSIDRSSLGQFLSATQRAANIKINAETSDAVKSVIDLRERLKALSESLASVEIGADDTRALSTIANLQLKIKALADRLTNLQIAADDTKAVARITGLQVQIEKLSARLENLDAEVDIQHALAQIAALKAELDLLVAKREEVRVGISADGLASFEAQLLSIEAATSKFRESLAGEALTGLAASRAAVAAGDGLAKLDTVTRTATSSAAGFTRGIRGWGLGLLTATVPLYAGATAVSGFHLALDAIVELLAVAVPALTAAAAGLGAFAIAASDSARQVYQMVTSIHTVGDAMDATIPPMTGKLEALHDQVRPQVWQVYGDAIDVVHTKTGLFNQLAVQTGSLLDTWAAKITVLVTSGTGGLENFLKAGERDAAEFGRIGQSLGDVFGKLIEITTKTHIAEDLLAIVGAAARLVDMVSRLPIPLLAVVVGLHGLWLWGGLATTGIVNLVGAFARMAASVGGVKLAGTALGDLSKNSTGLEKLGASAGILGASIKNIPARIASLGSAIAGLATNPWTWAVIGVAALTALTIWTLHAKDATDKWIDSSNKIVNSANLYTAVNTTAGQLAETTKRVADAQDHFTQSLDRTGPNAIQAGHDIDSLNQHHQDLVNTLSREIDRTSGVAKEFGTTLPGALALATFAGVKLSDLTSKSNQTWDIAVQKIRGVVEGYKAMGQGSSQLGNDINVINVGASDQAKAIQNLNTAWDGFIKIVGAPVDTFLTFSQSLVKFGNDASVAGARMTGLGSGIESVAKKVTNSSIQLQEDFQASFEAANQLFDAMRSAQAPADQQIKAVKDTVATLIPLAGTSKVAAAEISALAQEAGGPATTNLQTLQKWAGVTSKEGLQGLQKDTNNAAVAMSNLSQDAQKLGSTLQSDLNAEMAKAVEHAVGLQGAMDAYTKSLHDNGAASSETEKDRKTLQTDLMDIFHNAGQVNATMKTLSGTFTDNGAAANAARKYRQQAVQDFQDQADKAKDAKSDLQKYTQEIQDNGKNTDAAKKVRQQLITDLINAGVNAKTARADVDNYTTSIKGNATNTDAARKARQQLIVDILNANNNAKAGKTDVDNLTNAIEGHGKKSQQYQSARAQLIKDLENAGLSAKAATALVNNLTTAITQIPKNPNVVMHMKGDGSYTITGAGPRAIPNGPAQLAPLAFGGRVPGWGGGDRVPAILEGGEVVVPKGMVSQGAVDHLRGKLPGFAAGGLVTTNVVPASNPAILPKAMYTSFTHDVISSLSKAMADSINAAKAAAAAAALAGGTPGRITSGVNQWRGLVLQALSMEGLSTSLVNNVLYQMQTESGGNEAAINLTDSNAKAGTPSKGLLQVIGPTFSRYHWPGTSNNIYDPLANIAAALNYARHVYGPNLANQYGGIGSGHGYALGGKVADQGAVLKPGWNPPLYNGTGRDEPLMPQDGGMSGQVATAILTELRAIRMATQAAPGHYAQALNGAAGRAANAGYYS
jgi:hypothetical protein